mgnify:CR=1 FL=1
MAFLSAWQYASDNGTPEGCVSPLRGASVLLPIYIYIYISSLQTQRRATAYRYIYAVARRACLYRRSAVVTHPYYPKIFANQNNIKFAVVFCPSMAIGFDESKLHKGGMTWDKSICIYDLR